MRVIVLSDVHGKRETVLQILRREMAGPAQTRPDYLLFLGDGLREVNEVAYHGEFAALAVLSVRGNCDWFGADDTPDLREIPLGNIRVMMMHGHRFEVKAGTDRAAAFAASRGADLLLFGHTHLAYARRIEAGETVGGVTLAKPLTLFNPGSVGYGGEYGVITVAGERIECVLKRV